MSVIDSAANIISGARHVVCLTGAGVSAESGIATFRDAQSGLWSRFDPEQLASQAGFAADPGLVWRWYMSRLTAVQGTAPNPGHVALAQLESRLKRFDLITQNVDDLHERAGSRTVFHLHGNLARFRCNRCEAEHRLLEKEQAATMPPDCLICGSAVRPDVVWFGEMLPSNVLRQVWRQAETCDVMLVVGTSGVVYPAAQLPLAARQGGAALIEVNIEPTLISEVAEYFLEGSSGEILPQLLARVEAVL
ncbi:MAG: NAD-dependent deacylase [Caldilineaceae bacterium]|nr:NAD-dependent deacylase [Caldilineaceae bacterium]